MLYCTKPKSLIALTFDELVIFGLMVSAGENVHDGLPWSFIVNGVPVSHENDECYVICGAGNTKHMTRNDILIVGERGKLFVCPKDAFVELCAPSGATKEKI